MPLTIDQFYPDQFGTQWEHLVQQETSRLKDIVTIDNNFRGKRKSYNQQGTATMQEVTTRNGVTVANNTSREKRWINAKPYAAVEHFDEWDDQILGDVIQPTSQTVAAHRMAAGRTFDQIILNAAEGTAITGEEGTVSTVVPSGQKVAVNYVASGSPANSGLTLAKLIRIKSLFGRNEAFSRNSGAMGDKICFAHSQQQLDDLLNNVAEIKSSDFNNVKALVEGEVDHFMGIYFVRTELTTLDASTDIRTCPAWVKSGLVFTAPTEVKTRFSIRDDLDETMQIRSKLRAGATRLQEEKVVLTYCDESP